MTDAVPSERPSWSFLYALGLVLYMLCRFNQNTERLCAFDLFKDIGACCALTYSLAQRTKDASYRAPSLPPVNRCNHVPSSLTMLQESLPTTSGHEGRRKALGMIWG